jgi:hypothetical protein
MYLCRYAFTDTTFLNSGNPAKYIGGDMWIRTPFGSSTKLFSMTAYGADGLTFNAGDGVPGGDSIWTATEVYAVLDPPVPDDNGLQDPNNWIGKPHSVVLLGGKTDLLTLTSYRQWHKDPNSEHRQAQLSGK